MPLLLYRKLLLVRLFVFLLQRAFSSAYLHSHWFVCEELFYTQNIFAVSDQTAYKINIFHCIYWLNVKAFGIHFFLLFCSPLNQLEGFYNHSFVPFIQSSFILKFTEANYQPNQIFAIFWFFSRFFPSLPGDYLAARQKIQFKNS